MDRSTLIMLALLAPVAATAQQPAVTYRVLADVDTGAVGNVSSPDGRFILVRGNEVLDVKTGRRTSLGAGGQGAWSPRGDLIAFAKRGKDGSGTEIWTEPMDSGTGAATGPARRVSLHQGSEPFFSADGRSIIYFTRSGDTTSMVEIPTAGGPERLLFRERGYDFRWGAETPDGRWIYFQDWPVGHYWRLRISRIPAAGGTRQTIIARLAHYSGLSRDGRYLAYFPDPSPFNRHHPTLVVANAGGREVARIHMPLGSSQATWGPGHTMVYIRWTIPEGVHGFDLGTGALQTITPYSFGASHPAYSPDGRLLAVMRQTGDGYELALLPTAGGPARLLPTRPEPESNALSWSPDGSAIGFLTEDGGIAVVDVTSGRETVLLAKDADRLPLAWRRDGRAVLYLAGDVGRNGTVREVTLDGHDREVRRIEIPASTHNGAGVAFAGDSALVVLSPGLLRVLPLAGGERTLAMPLPEDGGDAPSVSPDGRWVAYPAPDSQGPNSRDVVTIVPLAGGPSHTLPLTRSNCGTWLSWHPDSKHIAVSGYNSCGDYGVQIYLLPINGDAPRRLTVADSSADFDDMSFSPDGSTLAVECEQMPRAQIMLADLEAVLAATRGRGGR
jgi:Tol biopolymer transport system component